jgi:Zn-dependent M28 family amino/carboxypeptidase
MALIAACSEPEQTATISTESVAEDRAAAQTASELDLPALKAVVDTSVTEAYLREITTELSSDAYGGRGPGSAGDEMTQTYLSNALRMLGYRPGGTAEYLQKFELVGLNASQPPEWLFNAGDEALSLRQNDDFIAASGVQAPEARVTNAEVVFVGYGIQAPEFGWDDFKDADLRGKVLLMLNNDPDWDPALFGGETRLRYGRWDYKYESAARQGAAGAIIIHTQPSAGYPWQVVQSSWSGAQFQLPAGDEPRLQIQSWITEDAAKRLFDTVGMKLDELVAAARGRDFLPVPLGITTSLTLPVAIERTQTANVIGVLPGSDPLLADEVVIYTAHHDHLGIAPPGDDPAADRIYNGALDNASGMAVILGVAKAIAALPEAPRRTTVINFVGGEEQGLLGSLYYARNPTYPPGRIAANINVDGASIWGPARDLTYIGYGKSSLDEVVQEMATFQGRMVRPDQFPDRGSFYRSDQFSFASIGVPAVYLDGGTDIIGQRPGWGEEQINRYIDEHYHQPGDEIDPNWRFDGVMEDVLTNFLVGLRIANAAEMPRWNPGDEFEAARLAALRAVE